MSILSHFQDNFFKLAGLPKKGGWFNSAKHSSFIFRHNFDLILNSKDLTGSYGISKLLEGQKATLFIGENVFAHGNRGRIPYEMIYIYDKFGVVSVYHIGGTGHGDQWYHSKDKVTLKFQRNEKSPAPVWVTSFDEDQIAEKKVKEALPVLEDKRQVVEGEVQSIKEVFSEFGSTMKMLLLLVDGNKVYATIPKNIIDSVEAGSKLSMNVTLKQAEQGFYFGSRPAKGLVL